MSVCHEPGCHTIFQEASPTFKKRFMYMSGITDEAEFDKMRQGMTWEGHADKVKVPYLCVAGEFDELIRDLRSSLGLTVFMVTHDLDTLFSICDRVAVLVDKKLRVGSLEEMLRDDHPWIRSYFHGPRGRAALLSEAKHPAKPETGAISVV